MTEYYNEEENANFHTLRYFYFALNEEYYFCAFSFVEEGEIVAARYSDENSYYRFDCCFHYKLLT